MVFLVKIGLLLFMNNYIIFDFNSNSSTRKWKIVDDVVMGGKSNGNFNLTTEGHGHFWGYVSLDNNGGFSSVRHQFNSIELNSKTKVILKIKGDSKKYQFRIKNNINNFYSYIFDFQTNGQWQTLELPLNKFTPSFRGRVLNQPNFDHQKISEISFLIANKKNESFNLLIDQIYLQ